MEKCGSNGEAEDMFACRMYIACRSSRTKCHGHNVADKILWGQNVIGQNVETFCPRHFVHNILSTAFCSWHFVQWHFVHITFCPRHFVRDISSGDILSSHLCRYTAAMQPARQKWGYVESQYRKFKQWSLVRTASGWLVCGRSDRWIVGGWIYSKPVGWLVCLLVSVVGRIYGRWLASRLICLLSSLWVGWTIRRASYIQSITVWPANHPSIYLIVNQPTKDCSFISACIRSMLEFLESGVRRLPVFVWLVGCGRATWPMLASRWPSLERFSSSLSRGYTISPWSPILVYIWERSKRGVWLALPCHVSVHIYFHVAYTAPSAALLPIPPTCNGLKSIFGDTTIDSANTPWSGILEKALFGDSNHEFLYVIVVFTVFPRLSQVWGGICSHPHVICTHCPILISGRGNFKRHFVATPIMLAILLSFHYVGNLS